MYVYRKQPDGFLKHILTDPGDCVVLYREGQQLPDSCPIDWPVPPEHGEARYIVRDSDGWYYAADRIISLGNSQLRRVGPILEPLDTAPGRYPNRRIR